MNHEYEQDRAKSPAAATNHNDTAEPGQSSRSALLHKPAHPVASGLVQRRANAAGDADPSAVHAAAAQGVATTSSQLPHLDTIQRAFGRHDISSVQAHTGPEASASARAMGAQAFATGNHVVLGEGADLHTVAHEAAHVVQQRGGVQLKGGVGEVGDPYERHADDVANAVVLGKSAEGLLDRIVPGSAGGAVQRSVVQLRNNKSNRAYQQYADRNDVPARAHVFTPEFADGRPTGLHAYTDGALPEGVQELFRHGNDQSVHIIVWTHPSAIAAGNRYCKWSTMFPRNMPKSIVCFYLLKSAGLVSAAESPSAGTSWTGIEVSGAGNTRFPVHPGSANIMYYVATQFGDNFQAAAPGRPATITIGGVTYRFNN